MLEPPFFFPRDLRIPAPDDFAKNIVTGKGYDFQEHVDLWDAVRARILAVEQSPIGMEPQEVMFTESWVRNRLGQGTFRSVAIDAYARRCPLTGEKILPVLQASHIKPVTVGGQHRIDNGLLLRSDVHTLLDKGYLGVSPDYRLLVSRRLRQEFANGALYYQLAGQEVRLPELPQVRPVPEWLEWHIDRSSLHERPCHYL